MRKIGTIVGSTLALLMSVGVGAQQPAPSFEAASVKSTGPLDPQKLQSGQQRVGMKMGPGRVDIESASLAELVSFAFQVKPNLVSGPNWLTATNASTVERFDIHATLPAGARGAQVPQMLQSLLADRFKLAVHRERKDQNVYALVVGKNGATLEPAAPDPPPSAAPAPQTTRPDAVEVTGNPQTGTVVRGGGAAGAMRVTMGQDGSMHLVADKCTMAQLITSIERFLDRPVVDMSELKGVYKVALDLSKDDLAVAARAAGVVTPATPGATPADPAGTSVFQSLERMGLKLDARKSPVEFLVVDHVERTPTAD